LDGWSHGGGRRSHATIHGSEFHTAPTAATHLHF
jgi:hypothetical protein